MSLAQVTHRISTARSHNHQPFQTIIEKKRLLKLKEFRSQMKRLPSIQQKIWQKIQKKPWILTIVTCLLVVILWQAPVVKPANNKALQGTWMTHLGVSLMYHSSRLDDTIADLAKHKINTLYPAVWNHGHTLFRSEVVKRAGGSDRNPWANLAMPFSDAFGGLVTQADRQNIRLIPWFEYGLMIPLDSEIIKRHPTWLTQQKNGQKTDLPTVKNPFPHPIASLRHAIIGREQGWLNPFHPEVQEFLISMIVEVVKDYPVAGIQLDDHFALPIEYGYDPDTIKLYQTEHSGQLPGNPTEAQWMRWRADRLTELMARIHKAIKSVRQDAILSLSPNTADYAYRKSLQDWPRWVKMGLVDEVIVQLYRPSLESLKTELEDTRLKTIAQTVPLSIGLYTGPFKGAKAKKQIDQEVSTVRSAGYAGTAFFCWETTFWIFRGR
jgi:uncharacterized lipoprotein YddW (UPF0748 family)